jgi:tetratricopeptide (TPR) repeat protein
MADRYMYIPMIGLSIIVAWGVPVMFAKIPLKRIVLAAAGAIALAGLTFTTYWQVRLWTNSLTLYEHALQVTEDNFFAHYGLGQVYAGQGKFDQAITHFSKAVHINPTKVTLYNDLGRSLAIRGNINEARIQFVKALEIKPDYPATHFYLANILVIQNQFDKAIYHFSEALRLHPDFPGTGVGVKNTSVLGYHQLVSMYDTRARLNQAIDQNQKILSTHSQNLDALRKLVIAYSLKGDDDSAFALLQVNRSTRARIRDITRGYADWRPLAP